METADLIRALAQDNDSRGRPPWKNLTLALAVGGAVALSLTLGFLGLRPHLLTHVGETRVLFKLFFTSLLAALSTILVLSLFRPDAAWRAPLRLLAIAPVLLVLANLGEISSVPVADWGARLWGVNAFHCLRSIPLLSFATLIAVLLALRQGAPDRPAIAGAGAGLLAGAVGAFFYATHCPDDSPFFVTVWYSLAIGFMTAAGALIGSRVLRW
jgi:hypothetical protein